MSQLSFPFTVILPTYFSQPFSLSLPLCLSLVEGQPLFEKLRQVNSPSVPASHSLFMSLSLADRKPPLDRWRQVAALQLCRRFTQRPLWHSGTLTPEPSNLNLEPQTLNLKPQTPNPRPSTLNPEP